MRSTCLALLGAFLALVGASCSTGDGEEPAQSPRATETPTVEVSGPPPKVAARLLPDLRQEPPTGLVLTHPGRRFRIGFDSAATNVGGGPLTIVGSRPGRGTATMDAGQIIPLQGGGRRRRGSVGVLRYVTSPDHSHWHLVPFMNYELRRAANLERVGRDRKTGFCLGDRYDAGIALPRKPSDRVYRTRCGLHNRALLRIVEGISVGYGDDYAANLEGQYVDITGVPAGRYYLVHEVNADRRLRERRYANNVSWLLLRLSWSRGAPRVAVLERCDPGTTRSGCALTG